MTLDDLHKIVRTKQEKINVARTAWKTGKVMYIKLVSEIGCPTDGGEWLVYSLNLSCDDTQANDWMIITPNN